MKKILSILIGAIWVLLSCVTQRQATIDEYLVIENVNVIEVTTGDLLPTQTVVVKDSLIHFVGQSWSAPTNGKVTIINGEGKYLLPGFWDMHFHLAWEASNEDLLFGPMLAHGITGIRDMGGDLAIQRSMKEKVAADPTLGPEIFGAGPILDGDPPVMYDFSIPLSENSEVAPVLDSLITGGADFFKTYSLLPESVLARIAAYAAAHNYSFAGHLSEYVEPERAITLGQKSVEHLNRLDEIWLTDTARLGQIAQLMNAHGTWLCPTLIIYSLKAHMRDTTIFQPAYDQYLHPALQQEWRASRASRMERSTPADWQEQERFFQQQKALVLFLHRAGVRILAGSDFAGMPYVYPGIGLHQEMQLLGEAGLTNAEVLATVTINPALFMGMEEWYGTVTPGKYADLVLLSGNPFEDIAAVRQIAMVFRKGRRVAL